MTRRHAADRVRIARLLEKGVGRRAEFRRIKETFGPAALDEPAAPRPPRRPGRVGGPYGPQAKKVLELSLREARALGDREIGSPHLLLALLRQGVSEPLSAVLAERGVTYDEVRRSARLGREA